MTREKAIEMIQNDMKLHHDYLSGAYRQALNMAIKALKAMDEDLIRRQDALNCFHAWIDKHGDVQEPDDMAEYRAIENLPSVMEDEE